MSKEPEFPLGSVEFGVTGPNGSEAFARPEEIAIGPDGKEYIGLRIQATDDEAAEVLKSRIEQNIGPAATDEEMSRGSKSFGFKRWNSSWQPKGPKTPWKQSGKN